MHYGMGKFQGKSTVEEAECFAFIWVFKQRGDYDTRGSSLKVTIPTVIITLMKERRTDNF